jgi:hypothetical protein
VIIHPLQKRYDFRAMSVGPRPSHLGCNAAPIDIEAVIGPGKKVGLMRPDGNTAMCKVQDAIIRHRAHPRW